MKKLTTDPKFLMGCWCGFFFTALLFLFFSCKCNAQTQCQNHLSYPAKGDTVIMKCDSLTLVSTSLLRSTILFERNKNAALIRLNVDKDRAVKELVSTYENRIQNFQKQIETLEAAYRKTIESYRETLYESRIATESVTGSVKALEYQFNEMRRDALERETALKKLAVKRSIVFGCVGVGVGGILTTLIFVAK